MIAARHEEPEFSASRPVAIASLVAREVTSKRCSHQSSTSHTGLKAHRMPTKTTPRALSLLIASRLLFMKLLAVAVATLVWVAPSPPEWHSPIVGGMQMLRVFSLPNGQYQAGHRGIDIRAEPDQAVVAPAPGEVTFVGVVVDRPVLTLRISGRYLLSFEPVSSELAIGDWVQRGEVIGTVAGIGHCTQPCMHLGVRDDGTYLNPARFFRDLRPRLLPVNAAVTGGTRVN